MCFLHWPLRILAYVNQEERIMTWHFLHHRSFQSRSTASSHRCYHGHPPVNTQSKDTKLAAKNGFEYYWKHFRNIQGQLCKLEDKRWWCNWEKIMPYFMDISVELSPTKNISKFGFRRRKMIISYISKMILLLLTATIREFFLLLDPGYQIKIDQSTHFS